MKARPRQAENRIAEILSDFFVQNGLSPVERIPVLGRTGPDLTINEACLVVDVKSRKSCPKTVFKELDSNRYISDGSIAFLRLETLSESLRAFEGTYATVRSSKIVADWLNHMDEWTDANMADGISAIVLHIPQMPYGKSVMALHQSDVGLLRERITQPDVIGRNPWLRLVEGGIVVGDSNGESLVEMLNTDYQKIEEWLRSRNGSGDC